MSNYSIWPSDGSITLEQAIDMLREKQKTQPYEMWGLHDFSKDSDSEYEVIQAILDVINTAPLKLSFRNGIKVGMPHYWKWWCEEVYEDVDWSNFPDTISIFEMKRHVWDYATTIHYRETNGL